MDVSMYGDLGNYKYSSVKRYFVIDRCTIWNLNVICFPFHFNNNHWATLILNVTMKKVFVIDSKKGYIKEEDAM